MACCSSLKSEILTVAPRRCAVRSAAVFARTQSEVGRAAARCAPLIGLLWSLGGCVTYYQPLLGLQRPVAIDPRLANFQGVNLKLRCEVNDYFDSGDASRLCEAVDAVFTNQGAKVETEVTGEGQGTTPAVKPDLTLDLKPRLLREENSALWWLVSVASLTLIPSVAEYDFAQDVAIRDASGFLLVSDSLQGRFVRYFGLGVWALHGVVWGVESVLDYFLRPKAEKISARAFQEDFSRDFYGQLSQLAFNARMRSYVLREFEPAPARAVIETSPPPVRPPASTRAPPASPAPLPLPGLTPPPSPPPSPSP